MRKWRRLAGLTRTAKTSSTVRRLISGFGLFSLVLGSMMLLSGAAVSADSAKGDIWTQPHNQGEETPKGHSQEVHLPCAIVDIWGDKLDAVANQGWTLFHLPPPNPPAPGTVVATGTYSTNGSHEKIGEIAQSVFEGAPGPHFKIEVYNNGDKKSKTFWVECGPVTPTLITTPNLTAANLGDLLKDTANIAGNVPTGTITFTLHNPSNTVVDTEQVTVEDDGAYTTPTGYTANVAGAWYWEASYSGDAHNSQVTSDKEPFTVNKADPSITTTQDPASASVGAALKDKATLSGGFNPTGTIKFSLVLDSTQTEVFTSTVTVAGNGDYLASSGTTTGDNVAHNAGNYHWVAVYSGDGNNNGKTSANEPVTITEGGAPTVPAITTTTIPSSTTVGKTLKDSASLSGVEAPNGKITFTLYYPDGSVAYTEDVSGVTANGTYTTANGFVATVAGTWHWKAAFIQDGEVVVQSNAADEPVTVSNAGAVLAATGVTPPTEMLALLLMAFGISAIAGGALAMRRREA